MKKVCVCCGGKLPRSNKRICSTACSRKLLDAAIAFRIRAGVYKTKKEKK